MDESRRDNLIEDVFTGVADGAHIQSDEKFSCLIEVDNISDKEVDRAQNFIGYLLDVSFYAGELEGLEKGLALCRQVEDKELTPRQESRLFYQKASAHQDIHQIEVVESGKLGWEDERLEKILLYLRESLHRERFDEIEDDRKRRTFTNLGNHVSSTGRWIEAFDYWDQALEIHPEFGMAIGNKGLALKRYADCLYTPENRLFFYRFSHSYIKKALDREIEAGADTHFLKTIERIENSIPEEALDREIEDFKATLDNYELDVSEEEQEYRKWCLENGLFLNPLNDLGPYKKAATDNLHLPNMRMDLDEPFPFPDMFNLMKQEYVSARFLFYESITHKNPHFSDKGNIQTNPQDYPVYSLHGEKAKIAFRMAYSLFDKIAYFLYHYYKPSNLPKRSLNLKNVWYKSPAMDHLSPEFKGKQNPPLIGLHWLSKDLELQDDRNLGVKGSLDPGASEMAEIRNALEHRYFKLHQSLWPGEENQSGEIYSTEEGIAVSMYREDFNQKVLESLNRSRAALIYLCLSTHLEEQEAKGNDDESRIDIPSDTWDFEWKT